MKYIFISSTFKDMQAERDSLHQNVFPGLRKRMNTIGDDLQELDLRWGVDTTIMSEEESGIHVIETCIDAIDQCKPYVVVLLGDRYGWIPDSDVVRIIHDDRLTENYEAESSITHLEIVYGSEKLTNLDHCIFCFRDNSFLKDVPENERGIYDSESEEHKKKLDALKAQILEEPKAKIIHYNPKWNAKINRVDELEEFNKAIEAAVWEIMSADIEEIGQQSPEKRAIENAVLTAHNYLGSYVYDRKMSEQGARAVFQEKGYWVLGEAGSGKSAYMASIALNAKRVSKKPFIYYCGNENCSNVDMLINTLYFWVESVQSGQEFQMTDEIRAYDNARKLAHIAKIIESRKDDRNETDLVLLIDGVDQMQGRVDHVLSALAKATTTIASSLPEYYEKCRDVLKGRFPWTIPMQPFSPENADSMILMHALRRGKALDSKVYKAIHAKKSYGNPLYLSLLLQRLFMMDKDEFFAAESLSPGMAGLSMYMVDLIEKMPDELETLAEYIVEEAVHKSSLGGLLEADDFKEFMQLVAVSEDGVRLRDYENVLEQRGRSLPYVAIEKLLYYLYDSFDENVEGYWNYKHRVLREFVLRKLTSEERKRCETILFNDFMNKGEYAKAFSYNPLQEDCLLACAEFVSDVEVQSLIISVNKLLADWRMSDKKLPDSYALRMLITRVIFSDFDNVKMHEADYQYALSCLNMDAAVTLKEALLWKGAKLIVYRGSEEYIDAAKELFAFFGEGTTADVEDCVLLIKLVATAIWKCNYYAPLKEAESALIFASLRLKDLGRRDLYKNTSALDMQFVAAMDFIAANTPEDKIRILGNFALGSGWTAGVSQEEYQSWPLLTKLCTVSALYLACRATDLLAYYKNYVDGLTVFKRYEPFLLELEKGLLSEWEKILLAEFYMAAAECVRHDLKEEKLTKALSFARQCDNKELIKEILIKLLDFYNADSRISGEPSVGKSLECASFAFELTDIGAKNPDETAQLARKRLEAIIAANPWGDTLPVYHQNGKKYNAEEIQVWMDKEFDRVLDISLEADGENLLYRALDTRDVSNMAVAYYAARFDKDKFLFWGERLVDASMSAIKHAKKPEAAKNVARRKLTGLCLKAFHMRLYEIIPKWYKLLEELEPDESLAIFPRAIYLYLTEEQDKSLETIGQCNGFLLDVSAYALQFEIEKERIADQEEKLATLIKIKTEMKKCYSEHNLDHNLNHKDKVDVTEWTACSMEVDRAEMEIAFLQGNSKKLATLLSDWKRDLIDKSCCQDMSSRQDILALANKINDYVKEKHLYDEFEGKDDLLYILLGTNHARHLQEIEHGKAKIEKITQMKQADEMVSLCQVNDAYMEVIGALKLLGDDFKSYMLEYYKNAAEILSHSESIEAYSVLGYGFEGEILDKQPEVVAKTIDALAHGAQFLVLDLERETLRKNVMLFYMNTWAVCAEHFDHDQSYFEKMVKINEFIIHMIGQVVESDTSNRNELLVGQYIKLLKFYKKMGRKREFLDTAEYVLSVDGMKMFIDEIQGICVPYLRELEEDPEAEHTRIRKIRGMLADNHDNWLVNVMYYMSKTVREYPQLNSPDEIEACIHSLYEATKEITL